MTSEFRKKLDTAVGTTEHIIALILDIRGFTPFCKEEESLNVANFIKRVYIRIIDDYFPKASFYKPTGDGLLIVIPYTHESLRDSLVKTIEKSLSLLQDFGKLCEGDEMIYFATPDKVGIGISRGAACCISSGGTVVDYSGRVINLASRLNDLARPCGIVFDSGLGMTLFPKEIQELFLGDSVYIRGIAEDKPIAIYYTKQYTIIPPSRKEPPKEPKWLSLNRTKTYGSLKSDLASGISDYSITLEKKPYDAKQIYVEVGFLDKGSRIWADLDVESKGVRYLERGTKNYLKLSYEMLINELESLKAKEDSVIIIDVSYPSIENSG